jgi:phenylacetate-CoA ligase
MIGPLQQTIELAKSHKFYSKLNLKGESIQEFPILTKKELFEKIEDLISCETFMNVYWSPSGGTTSNDYVFMFPSDFQENKKQRKLFANQLEKLKILSKETIALNLFFGSGLYRSQEIFSDYVDICSGTVFPGGYTFSDEDAFSLCKRFKVNTIMGYPSRIIKLAKYCQDNKLDLEISNFIYGAEKLESQKELYIREILKVKNIVGCYGSAESGVWAWTSGSNIYNYDPETMYTEFIDQTDDNIGSLIVTNLIRTKFPLIRYETGDLAIPIENGKFQLVSRKSNSFSIAGSYFSLSNLEQDFNSSVLEYQIHLYVDKESLLDILHFKIVSNDELKNKETIETLEQLFKFLNSLIVLKIEFVGVKDLKKSKNAEKVVKIVDTRY